MTSPIAQQRSSRLAWICALLTAFLGAAILFDAFPGINWTLWVIAACGSLIIARVAAAGRVETPLLVLTSWATLLSVAFALTGNEAIQFLIVVSDAMLLGLATITLGARSWSELSATLLATVPLLAPFRVAGASASEIAAAPRSIASPRTRSIVRGSLLTVPLVIVLIVLLASADPIIRWSTDRIYAWLPDWSFPPRLLFFVFLLALTLGANALAMRQLAPRFPQFPSVVGRASIGVTEQKMMLWAANIILWLFVVLQISYFIHPPPAAVGTGVTFAEFARRGFGELSFAVTLVGAIIIILQYTRPLDIMAAERAGLLRLEMALVIALELVLISAFRRVVLYEEAYGFTEARLFAQVYMVGMAGALGALALEISRGRISVAFGRRVAEIALAAFTILAFWNYEAWIVNKNVDRAAQTGKFDVQYARSLTRNAIPTLVARRNEVPVAMRDSLVAQLACKPLPAARRWFEWNRSAVAADAALRSWQRPPCERRNAPRRYD
jgi:hypothetical protein